MRWLAAFLVVALLSVANFAHARTEIEVDWRETALWNTFMDCAQTNSFMGDSKMVESNPLWKGFVERRDHVGFTLSYLATHMALDWVIQQVPDKRTRDWCYGAWAVAQLFTVLDNSSKGAVGFPIVVAEVRF